MSPTDEKTKTPETQSARNGHEVPRVSDRLKAARESKRASLQDAAQSTKIRTAYLEALESDRWEEFPAEVYLLGFLKTYSRFLGLPPQEMVDHFIAQRNEWAHQKPSAKPSQGNTRESLQRPARRWQPLLWGALLGAGTLIGLIWVRDKTTSSSAAGRPIEPPAGNVVQEHVLSVTAFKDTWFSVSTGGRRIFEGTIPAANIRTWRSLSFFLIKARNVTDIRVEIDGSPVNLSQLEGREIKVPDHESG